MNLYLILIAWFGILANVLTVFVMPSVFGVKRKPEVYNFGVWFAAILEAIITISLALRVLGFI